MIFLDGHTHIYDCYNLDRFFAAAFTNFSNATSKLQGGSSATCFMLLSEATNVHYFKKLQELSRAGKDELSTQWSVKESGEPCSLFIFHEDFPSMRLIVVAGRQLITKENLELLALMTDQEFENDMTLSKGVESVIKAGGIPVCPWGAGKWMGARGDILTQYMTHRDELFFLGDNGGRPSIWPQPSLLKKESAAARLLSGSDPLPLEGQDNKVGSFGTYIDCDCPQEQPAAFLKELLKKPEVELMSYGGPCCPLTFFKNQVALRVK